MTDVGSVQMISSAVKHLSLVNIFLSDTPPNSAVPEKALSPPLDGPVDRSFICTAGIVILDIIIVALISKVFCFKV